MCRPTAQQADMTNEEESMLYLGLFVVYVLPVLLIAGGGWFIDRRMKRARLAREKAREAKLARDEEFQMSAERWRRDNPPSWQAHTTVAPNWPHAYAPPYRRQYVSPSPTPSSTPSNGGIDPLMAGVMGYALGGGFSHHSHASPRSDFSVGGGSFSGAGSSSSWDSGSSSSSSCDSSSSSSSDSSSSSSSDSSSSCSSAD